jgi:hypothetical protein
MFTSNNRCPIFTQVCSRSVTRQANYNLRLSTCLPVRLKLRRNAARSRPTSNRCPNVNNRKLRPIIALRTHPSAKAHKTRICLHTCQPGILAQYECKGTRPVKITYFYFSHYRQKNMINMALFRRCSCKAVITVTSSINTTSSVLRCVGQRFSDSLSASHLFTVFKSDIMKQSARYLKNCFLFLVFAKNVSLSNTIGYVRLHFNVRRNSGQLHDVARRKSLMPYDTMQQQSAFNNFKHFIRQGCRCHVLDEMLAIDSPQLFVNKSILKQRSRIRCCARLEAQCNIKASC